MKRSTSETQIRDQLQYLAWLLDEAVEVPGTGFRIGIDGLLGLLPGVGDLISAGASAYIIRQASTLNVPRVVLLRMVLNVAIDLLIGAVPLVGDIFDFGWKANKKNVKLLVEHLENPKRVYRGSWATVLGLVASIIAILSAVIFMIGSLLAWVFKSLAS